MVGHNNPPPVVALDVSPNTCYAPGNESFDSKRDHLFHDKNAERLIGNDRKLNHQETSHSITVDKPAINFY